MRPIATFPVGKSPRLVRCLVSLNPRQSRGARAASLRGEPARSASAKSPLKSYRVYTSLVRNVIGENPPAWCASMARKPRRSASAKSPLKSRADLLEKE
jgi:hypothetical protein